MKKSLKIMSVFMSAMLTLGSLGAVSLTAGAQESIGTVTKITSGDFVYTVEDNVATIVDYTGSANALVIPQTIDGRKIVRIGDYALSKKAKLNSVVVPESVESIGSSAFEDSVDLKKVTLPDGVTKIGPSAFYGCSKLTTVNIPAKLEEIDDYTFSGCTQLTDIKLSESVTYVGESAFEGCSNLNSVTLSENTETIGDCAFYECDSLCSINLENVSQIGEGAFVYCANLDDIDLTNCSLIGENAFFVCQSLINIKFPDSIYSIPQTAFEYTLWEQSAPDGVLYAGDFAYKIIGDFTDSTLTFKDNTYAINDDFLSCNEYVKKINLPDSLTSIGASAFEGCSALKTVTIPDSCGVQAMAFYGCSSLTDINYNETAVWTAPTAFEETAWYNSQPDGIVYYGKSACAYKGDFAAAETVKDGTTIIVDGLFYGDEVLTSINLPDSVEYIGDMAFEDCINLKKISLPKSLYTLCDETFLGCESLESVELSEVVNIGVSAFAHCTSLKSIVIPESVEFGIDDSAFLNCTSLQKVTVNGNIQQIGSAVFMNCENLKSINIPKSVESIGNDVFEFCDNVTIKCYENSYAHEYAKTNGINYSLIFDEREFGDINNDGKVDVNDVTHLQRYIAGFTDESGAPIIPDSDLGYADITDEGTIDSRDVTALQMILTNK
ncbi:leucine-rich repeat protein [Ruminococcus sp.]